MTAQRIVFEMGACGRCGGGGEYSYCQRYGTMCFGCNGSGKRLTRNGRAAANKLRAFLEKTYSVPAREIAVGDRVRVSTMGGLKRGTVREVRADEDKNRGGIWIVTQHLQQHLNPDTLMEKIPTPQQFADEVIPFVLRFKGATIQEVQK